MSKFWVRRMGNQLMALSAEDTAEMMRLPFHVPMRVEVTQERRLGSLRYFWLLCQRIAAALGKDAEEVADELKYKTGHYEVVGERIVDHPEFGRIRDRTIQLKSISFPVMKDEGEFRKFLDRCVLAIVESYGMEREAVIDAVKDILDASAQGRNAA
jgi:hypothetical protein